MAKADKPEKMIKLAFQATQSMQSWSGYGGLTFLDGSVEEVREARGERLMEQYPDNFYLAGTEAPKIADLRPTVETLEDPEIRKLVGEVKQLAAQDSIGQSVQNNLKTFLEMHLDPTPAKVEDCKAKLARWKEELSALAGK